MKKAQVLEDSVEMLSHCEPPAFFQSSKHLYGAPKTPLLDEESTSLELAHQFSQILDQVSGVDLGAPPEACILASTVASSMEEAVNKMFGDQAPEVIVVDQLSANALAGSNRIRLRKGACFTDNDIQQLIQHEAYVHVATALNGSHQPILKFMGSSTPASTKTQEGLAVFAELITGC